MSLIIWSSYIQLYRVYSRQGTGCCFEKGHFWLRYS